MLCSSLINYFSCLGLTFNENSDLPPRDEVGQGVISAVFSPKAQPALVNDLANESKYPSKTPSNAFTANSIFSPSVQTDDRVLNDDSVTSYKAPDTLCSPSNIDDIAVNEIESCAESANTCHVSGKTSVPDQNLWNHDVATGDNCLKTNLPSNCAVQSQKSSRTPSFYNPMPQENVVTSFPKTSTETSGHDQGCRQENSLQFDVMPDGFIEQQFTSSFNKQEVPVRERHIRNTSCEAEVTTNQSLNQQPAMERGTPSMLQGDAATAASVPKTGYPCSKMYKGGRVDSLSGPNSQIGTCTTAVLGHSYHGNGDIGSSSGYETQSNNSASPYTSPDSIASVNHHLNDLANCSSSAIRHADHHHHTTVPQGPMCRSNSLQSRPQQLQSTVPSTACSSNSDSGEVLMSPFPCSFYSICCFQPNPIIMFFAAKNFARFQYCLFEFFRKLRSCYYCKIFFFVERL